MHRKVGQRIFLWMQLRSRIFLVGTERRQSFFRYELFCPANISRHRDKARQTITDNVDHGVADHPPRCCEQRPCVILSFMQVDCLAAFRNFKKMLGLRRQNKPLQSSIAPKQIRHRRHSLCCWGNFGLPLGPIEGHPAPILCLAWEMNCTVGDLP